MNIISTLIRYYTTCKASGIALLDTGHLKAGTVQSVLSLKPPKSHNTAHQVAAAARAAGDGPREPGEPRVLLCGLPLERHRPGPHAAQRDHVVHEACSGSSENGGVKRTLD